MNPSSIAPTSAATLAAMTALLFSSSGQAQPTDTTATATAGESAPETIVVLGRRLDTRRVAGSAHSIDSETLASFEYDDIQRVLTKIPGVYVRDEDGFGLRPNIGLRGANSDRSSRVVLMEDGVLLGPAPYSAPAAYYTPLTTRMDGVEVFKGPASIRYGPYTVGGAINYLTTEIPIGHGVLADVAGGQFGYNKLHGRYGWGGTHLGFLIEGVRVGSTGFKTIDEDPDADTGFTKNEVMLKARLNSDPAGEVYHRLDIKLGYADEGSNETYLGLTDADFAADPLRRYVGSRLARMDWTRTQIQVSYGLQLGYDVQIKLTGYRHDFDRAWLKLNRLRNLSGTDDVAADTALRATSGSNFALLELMRGTRSTDALLSGPGGDEVAYLGIGTNDRRFVSQGAQLDGEYRLGLQDIDQTFRFGVRVHYDEIARRHDEAPYSVLALDGEPTVITQADPVAPTRTDDENALAVSFYVQDELTLWDNLVLTPGLRTELIFTESVRTPVDGSTQPVAGTRDDVVLVPGIGAYYQALSWLGVLAGVHRGFSPVAPGQSDDVEPETSWNYEAGVRLSHRRSRAELIGFFSDYSNFLVTCTFSQGCPDNVVDRQFNASDVNVGGLEASLHHEQRLGIVRLTVDAAYTLTMSRFLTSFQSGSPQFANVEEGDELPYVPVHQSHVALGTTVPIWGIDTGLLVSYTFIDRMRNEASQGEVPDDQLTDVQHIVDATLQVDFTEEARLYVRGDNLLDQRYIASRRPFGARPGKPLQVQVGFTYRFGQAY